MRVQEITNKSDPYSVGPSKIAFTRRLPSTGPANFLFDPITYHSVVLEPRDEKDELGIEDPRLTYDSATKTYYLMFTAVAKNSDGSASAYLSLATAENPTHASGSSFIPSVLISTRMDQTGLYISSTSLV